MRPPRRKPRPELEWTLADVPEDAAGQAAPESSGPPPRPRRRWVTGRGAAVVVLLIGAAALGAWLTVQTGWQRLRTQVAQEAAYEDAQSLAGAVEVVVAMQAADDPAWRQARAAEAAVGLPAPLPAAHLLPSGDPPTLTDLRLVADNVFAAEVQRTYHDAAGQTYTFDYVQHYRNLGPGLWERLPPSGSALTGWRGDWMRATFPVSDTALLQPLLTQLDLALGQACTVWQCRPGRLVTFAFGQLGALGTLSPDRPSWEPEAGRAPYPITFDLYPFAAQAGDPLVIEVPSPQLAGKPHDAAAEGAMRHALTVQALIALATSFDAPKQLPEAYMAALLARAEVRLGLAAPFTYAPQPETYRAPQSAWTLRPPDTATRLADQQQALALLSFALAGQPAALEGALLATLSSAPSVAAWLGAALDTDGPALLRAWAAQVQPRLEAATTLPRAALAGLAYRCGPAAALLRAEAAVPLPIRNNWVALRPEALSADGRYFAAIERIDPLHIDLRVMDLHAGTDRTVDGAGSISILGWTADGRLLYQRQEDVSQPAEAAQLAQLDPATGAWEPWLAQLAVPGYAVPVWWRPDHRALFLPINPPAATTPGVYTLARVAVAGAGTIEDTFHFPRWGELAPDGRYLVSMPAAPATDGLPATLGGLVLLHPDETAPSLLLTLTGLAAEGAAPDSLTPLVWSPNGAQVALVARGAGYGVRVLSIGANGVGLREHVRFTEAGSAVRALAFSADAAYLAMQVTAADGQAAMTIIVDLATGRQVREALAGHAGLVWAPTGHRLAVMTPDGIRVRDLDTGAVRWATLGPCEQMAWYRLP